MNLEIQDEDLRPLVIGRYALHRAIARGGMATVHLGRLLGPVGFSRTVAIKRLHPQLAHDPEFVTMFLDEARLAARVTHPNVVSTLDVVATKKELFLVMEYVPGESLGRILRAAYKQRRRMPLGVASSIMSGVLHGLHAAHEARTERGEPLAIVHRDVSPQNILIGADGIARVLDFGIAKAAGQMHETRLGTVKGKLAYMAPEQLSGAEACRLADIYSGGVVLWELIAGRRLFSGKNAADLMEQVLSAPILPPSEVADCFEPRTDPAQVLKTLDTIVLRSTRADATQRFPSAREMALAVEACVTPATPSEVAAWLDSIAAQALAQRANLVAEVESASMRSAIPYGKALDDGMDSDPEGPSLPRTSIPTATAPIETDATEVVSEGIGDSRSSLMATSSTTRTHSRETLLALIAGVGLIFGALGAFTFARHDSSSTPGQRGSTDESREIAPAIATNETAAPAAKDEVSFEEARPSDSAGPSANAIAKAAPPPSAKPRASSRAPALPTPAPDCWRIDGEGIKRLNTRDPRCMQ